MTWTSEEVYAKDLQPGDRFTSRWQGDHSVAMQEACTVVTTGYRPLGGLGLEIEMPSGDHATRIFAAGNRVFRWTESSEASEVSAPRFTLTDEKDPDHPGILDAERPDMVARFVHADTAQSAIDNGRGALPSYTLRTTGEPEVAAAVKGLGPSDEFEKRNGYPEPFLPKETTDRILAEPDEGIMIAHSMNPGFDSRLEAWAERTRMIDAARAAGWRVNDTAASYAAEASEDAEDDFPTEIEKLKALELHLGIRDFHDDKILELRRELRAMWGDD